MSLDYTDTWVKYGSLDAAPSGAATTVLTGGYWSGLSFNYKILHVTLGFLGTPANANTTFKLQVGNADLTGWTDVATYAITTANTVGTSAEVRLSDSATDATKNRIYRLVAVSSGANSGLLFFANVTLSAIGY